MIKSVAGWIANFDVTKAIVLGVFAVMASWYDLKMEVKITKQELTAIQQESILRFKYLEQNAKEYREDVKDIRSDLRTLLGTLKR